MKTKEPSITQFKEKALEIAKGYSEFKTRHTYFQKEILKFAEEYHEYKVKNFIL